MHFLSTIFPQSNVSHVHLALQPATNNQRPSTNNPAAITSAAAQLISLYIPPSLASTFAAAASAASITGDPAQILESAIIAPTTPPWLAAAVPSQYASNINALESAVHGLGGVSVTASGTGLGGVIVPTGTTNLGVCEAC